MTNVWFEVPGYGLPIDELLEHLRPLGVRLRKAVGKSVYSYDGQVLMKQIGAIGVHENGIISVAPAEGLSPGEVHLLVRCGAEAFENTPSRSQGWLKSTRQGRSWWTSHVCIAVEPGGRVSQAIARADRCLEEQLKLDLGSEVKRVDA